MGISRETISLIQDRIDIVDLISEYLPLKKQGTNYKALCPFHDDVKTPSFSVNGKLGFFYCFGCQEGGNAFNFLMKYKKISFYESLIELGNKVGIKVLPKGLDDSGSILLRIFKEACRTYSSFLKSNNKASDCARQYLLKRKIIKGIDNFHLGYAPYLNNFLFKKLSNFNRKDLLSSTLIRQSNDNNLYDYFRQRIIFPIFDEHDRIVAFGGRIIDKGEPKYLNSPENYYFKKKEILYGLNKAKEAIRKEEFVIVVEGYFDVIMAYELGIENIVAPLGTSLTQEHVNKLSRYCSKIVFAFDGDSAGAKAVKKALSYSLKRDIESYVFPLPSYMDPYDYLNTYGKESFLNQVANAKDAFDYYIEWEFDIEKRVSDFSKRQYLNTLYSFIHDLEGEVQKEQCLKKVAIFLKVGDYGIIKDFNRFSKRNPNRITDNTQEKTYIIKERSSELYLIFVILNNINLFNKYKNRIPIDLFKDAFAKKVFYALKDMYEKDGEIDIASLISNSLDKDERSIVSKGLLNQEYMVSKPNKAIVDCIKTIKTKELEKDKKNVSISIKRTRDNTRINELLEEDHFIVSEKYKLLKKTELLYEKHKT